MLNADDIAQALREEGDSDASARTVHYYRRQGILPPAYGRGDSAFGPEHLALMREARRLRREGLSVEEVRARLAGAAAPGDRPPSPAPATLTASAPVLQQQTSVDEAIRARGRRLPRSLRLRGGFVLQVPPDAADDLVARLYTAIDITLAAEQTTSRPKPSKRKAPR